MIAENMISDDPLLMLVRVEFDNAMAVPVSITETGMEFEMLTESAMETDGVMRFWIYMSGQKNTRVWMRIIDPMEVSCETRSGMHKKISMSIHYLSYSCLTLLVFRFPARIFTPRVLARSDQ